MSDEIEAFLQRAAQRRAQKQAEQSRGQAPTPPRPAIEIYDEDVVEADLVSDSPESRPKSSRSDSKDYYADSSTDQEDPQQAELLEKMRQLEEEQASQPEAAFDYDDLSEEETLPPVDIRGLLERPAAFREAVILTEILNRPKRW